MYAGHETHNDGQRVEDPCSSTRAKSRILKPLPKRHVNLKLKTFSQLQTIKSVEWDGELLRFGRSQLRSVADTWTASGPRIESGTSQIRSDN
jgi:hypothetical protein